MLGGSFWCCRCGLNTRPLPYQGSALPLSYGSNTQSATIPSIGVAPRPGRGYAIGGLSQQDALVLPARACACAHHAFHPLRIRIPWCGCHMLGMRPRRLNNQAGMMVSETVPSYADRDAPQSETGLLIVVSAAHLVSHFYILVLPVLIPLLKDRLGVGFLRLAWRSQPLTS